MSLLLSQVWKPCLQHTKNDTSTLFLYLSRGVYTRNMMSCCCLAANRKTRYNNRQSMLVSVTRQLHVSKTRHNTEKKLQTKVITFSNPIKYISLKIKLFLMQTYFDRDFREDQFIAGAKQVIFCCFVYIWFSKRPLVLKESGNLKPAITSFPRLYFAEQQKMYFHDFCISGILTAFTN